MNRISWTDEYSLGIDELDEDHRQIMALTDTYIDCLENGRSEAFVREAFDRLLTFTRYHFIREEMAMAACGYRGLRSHKMAHAQLIQELHNWDAFFEIMRDKGADNYYSDFVFHWFFEHMVNEDSKSGEFMVQKADTVEGVLCPEERAKTAKSHVAPFDGHTDSPTRTPSRVQMVNNIVDLARSGDADSAVKMLRGLNRLEDL
ncbi:MAG: bacteriohemerythrin [Magnetospiraceae bacterium]